MLQKNNIKIKPLSIGVYVGLDFVGDGLIKLPFIRSLRQVFPQAKITWIAGTHKSEFKRSLAPLVKGLLNEVIEEADRKAQNALEKAAKEAGFNDVLFQYEPIAARSVLSHPQCSVGGEGQDGRG